MANLPAEQMPVKINVKTVIRDRGEKQTFDLTAFGRFHQKGEAHFLQYDENMEAGTAKTIIKMGDQDGVILRSGAVKMRLPFRLNKKMRGSYELPYGTLEMLTTTKRFDHTYNETTKQGSIELLYELKTQGANTGTYHLKITFEEDAK
ncbi:DUF1934 domain-containing protein [Bacillus mesophilum]|uniref:DUF1934 family protein n=1 Tax=Bacillus mesophilum TaxID=1071718 RepID=A0A7V7RL58_9BACI|nr:DUF1934 domain-containing protein [Bacillus mesophilum]KAB2332472.1 DUF1934 family protein [Bacillus mesophilum]